MRRRRQLALVAVTILLHLVVFDWFGGQLGQRRGEALPQAEAPMTARLIASASPQPDPAAAPASPIVLAPPAPPPPLPQIVPDPVPADAGAPAQADATAAAAAAGAQDAGAPAGTPVPSAAVPPPDAAPASPAPAAVHENPVAAAATATPPTQDAAPAPAVPGAPPDLLPNPRRYKVDLPPSADITLDVARTDADGRRWNGEALLSWRVAPSSYRVRVEAGIRVVFARVNLLELASEGAVGEQGFVPTLTTEKRRGRSLTATHFNRKDGTLTFSASQAKYALSGGAQDKASLPLQLAAIARGDPKQLSGTIDVLVGEDRDASVFTFTVAGQEEIATRMGRIATWHLVRPPKSGSYHSRLELWLAPGYGWYPVQIRNTEANGAVTTQTVSNIAMKEAGSE